MPLHIVRSKLLRSVLGPLAVVTLSAFTVVVGVEGGRVARLDEVAAGMSVGGRFARMGYDVFAVGRGLRMF